MVTGYERHFLGGKNGLTFCCWDYFFNLTQTVYKMLKTQEPNTIEL